MKTKTNDQTYRWIQGKHSEGKSVVVVAVGVVVDDDDDNNDDTIVCSCDTHCTY